MARRRAPAAVDPILVLIKCAGRGNCERELCKLADDMKSLRHPPDAKPPPRIPTPTYHFSALKQNYTDAMWGWGLMFNTRNCIAFYILYFRYKLIYSKGFWFDFLFSVCQRQHYSRSSSLASSSTPYVNMLGNNNATMPCYLRYGIETEAETHHTQTHQHPSQHICSLASTHTHTHTHQRQIENEMRVKQQQWQ